MHAARTRLARWVFAAFLFRREAESTLCKCRVLGEGSQGARVQLARIDGALGMGGRIEYNVPRDPAGGQQLVNYGFTLNDLMAGQRLSAPVQALRCDGHQHMGAPQGTANPCHTITFSSMCTTQVFGPYTTNEINLAS